MLEGLKPLYNGALRPLARVFVAVGIHPNHLTVAGLLFFIAAGYLVAVGQWGFAAVAITVGSLMDGLDGVLARESGKMSVFGAILDSSCDRLTEMALLGGLSVYYLKSPEYDFWGPLLCFLAMCGSVMVSYIKARCEGEGIVCSRGILQRPERLILLGFGVLGGPRAMLWFLTGITVLGFYTVVQRFLEAAKPQSAQGLE